MHSNRPLLQVVMVFCLCLSLVMSFSSRRLNDDNFNYAIEELHEYDKALFPNDITLANPAGTQSPRFTANTVMTRLMHFFDDNWNNAALFVIRFNYVLSVILFFVLVLRFFPKFQFLSATIISSIFLSGYLISLGNFGLGVEDVFLSTGHVFAMLAIAVVLTPSDKMQDEIQVKQRDGQHNEHWNTAWMLLAIAEFMHVHEGIWAGSVVGLIWIADCISDKKILWKKIRALPIFIASLAIVILPALKGTGTVDSKLFSQIYVFTRTPHHLQVSSWGFVTIAVYFILLTGAWFYLRRRDKQLETIKKSQLRYGLLLIWTFFLIIVQYTLHEVFPSSTIITMYIPKCYRYITWLAELIYLIVGIDLFKKEKNFQGLCMLGIVIMPHSYGKTILALIELVLFALFTVLFFVAEKVDIDGALNRFFKGKYPQACIILVLFTLIPRLLLMRNITQLITAIPLLILAGFLSLKFDVEERKGDLEKSATVKNDTDKNSVLDNIGSDRKLTLICTSVVAVAILCFTFSFVYPKRDSNRKVVGIGFLNGDQFIKNSIDEDVYNLALRYKEMTDNDAVFLADPDDRNYNGFQLVSQRSCYALYKNTPSYKNAILEWYDRIEGSRKALIGKDEFALKTFMNSANLSDVLVSGDFAVKLNNSRNFDILASEGAYSIFRVKK